MAASASGADACIEVRLFGRFTVQRGDTVLGGIRSTKAQELLAYLLLHRAKPHARERLAAMFWGDVPTTASRKYLRQALWQARATMDPVREPNDTGLLLVDAEWVAINPQARLRLDVAIFEEACAAAAALAGDPMTHECRERLRAAVLRYRGDLLDGWYSEWCLVERDRLQRMYLVLLDALMEDCARGGRFEEGLAYGALSLESDRARERTHQHLIRLHALAGDRGAALRQYQRCLDALRDELAAEPEAATIELGRELGARGPARSAPVIVPVAAPVGQSAAADRSPLADVLGGLRQLHRAVADFQQRVDDGIAAVERVIGSGADVRHAMRLVAGGR